MRKIKATGWFPHLHAVIGVKSAGEHGVLELKNIVMLTLATGACQTQTYMTVAEARALAAALVDESALAEIGAAAVEAVDA